MTFEEKTNKLIKHLTNVADSDYNPLTIKPSELTDFTDWLMYVSEVQLERIKRERAN